MTEITNETTAPQRRDEQKPVEAMEYYATRISELLDIKSVEGIENQLLANATRMKQLDGVFDHLDAVIKKLNKEYDHLRLKVLPDIMAEDGIRTATFDGIGRVQLGGDCYASIVGDKKAEAYQWLRDHNSGSLIVETVNASTLKSWVKEKLEGGEELPEDLFKVQPYSRVSIVKVAAKKGKK